jgi:hypothetical protein
MNKNNMHSFVLWMKYRTNMDKLVSEGQ